MTTVFKNTPNETLNEFGQRQKLQDGKISCAQDSDIINNLMWFADVPISEITRDVF